MGTDNHGWEDISGKENRQQSVTLQASAETAFAPVFICVHL
jgi:hypothetical protein